MTDETPTPIAELPRGGYPTGFVPHLRVPFGLDRSGRVAVVDQDSDAEILQTVRVLLATRIGERAALPRYGMSDPTFRPARSSMTVEEIAEAVREEEPRVSVDQVSRAIDSLGGIDIVMGVIDEGE